MELSGQPHQLGSRCGYAFAMHAPELGDRLVLGDADMRTVSMRRVASMTGGWSPVESGPAGRKDNCSLTLPYNRYCLRPTALASPNCRSSKVQNPSACNSRATATCRLSSVRIPSFGP